MHSPMRMTCTATKEDPEGPGAACYVEEGAEAWKRSPKKWLAMKFKSHRPDP